jgi:hypothetical protein
VVDIDSYIVPKLIDKAYWKIDIRNFRNLVPIFGLPTKEGTEKPMFDYERILNDALLIYHISKLPGKGLDQ